MSLQRPPFATPSLPKFQQEFSATYPEQTLPRCAPDALSGRSREHAGVGRRGRGRLRHGVLEQDTPCGEPVEVWRQFLVISGATQSIGAESIDRYQDHVPV